MSSRNSRSPSAAGGDAGAGKAGAASGAAASAPDAAGPAAPPAGPATNAAEGAAETAREAPSATDDAAAALAAARPQEAARTLGAAAGSAGDAPSLGSGALAEVAAGTLGAEAGSVAVPVASAGGAAPGLYSAQGAHGDATVPELSRFGQIHPETRRALLAAEIAERRFTGAKLAVPYPTSEAALADFREAGFDLVIVSRQEAGFRRAGVVHPVERTLRRTQDFSLAELDLLRAEPMLVLTVLPGV